MSERTPEATQQDYDQLLYDLHAAKERAKRLGFTEIAMEAADLFERVVAKREEANEKKEEA